jgi:hypothetical protein
LQQLKCVSTKFPDPDFFLFQYTFLFLGANGLGCHCEEQPVPQLGKSNLNPSSRHPSIPMKIRAKTKAPPIMERLTKSAVDKIKSSLGMMVDENNKEKLE